MNKLEYLDKLETLLLRARLPKSEIDDILRDYAEYFEEGHRQGQSDSEISAKLGSPETVARQLIENSEEEQRRRKEESRRQAMEAAAQRKEQLRQKMQETGEGVGRAWKKGKESLKEALTLEEAGTPRKGGLWAGLGRLLGRIGHGVVWCMGLGLGIIGLGALMCFCVGLAMGLMGVWFAAAVVLLSGVGLMILTGLAVSLLSSMAAGGVAFFSGLSVSALGTLGFCLAWKLTRLYARLLFMMKEAVVWLGRRLFDRAPSDRKQAAPAKKEPCAEEWPQLVDTNEAKEGMSDETQW